MADARVAVRVRRGAEAPEAFRVTLWIKVDVDFFDHKKTARAGVPAAFLFLKMVAYCKRLAPDGRVAKEIDLGKLQTKANLAALVAAGFLVDEGDAWAIHDYGVWQTPSGELSAKRSEAGAKGAAKRWHPQGKQDGNGDGNCHTGLPSGPIAESESESDQKLPSSSVEPTTTAEGSQIRLVFEHWLAVMRRNPKTTKLDGKRKGKVRARLREGRSVADLCRAIDGCRASSWHMGDNPEGKRHDDLELICRDAAHVERFTGEVAPVVGGANGQTDMAALLGQVASSRAANAKRHEVPAS